MKQGSIEQMRGERKTTLKKERQILLVINEPKICKEMEDTIRGKFGYEVEVSEDGRKALEMLKESPWQYDVTVIYDNFKKGLKGQTVLKRIKKKYPEMEVIFIVASEDKTTADAWLEGAFNCFFLPINYEGIAYAVKFAREQAQFRRERKILEELQQLSIAINSLTILKETQELTCKAAKEILNADHSALVLFDKTLLKGEVIAEYPKTKDFIGKFIYIKGIPTEEELVYHQTIINEPDVSKAKGLGKVQKILMDHNVHSVLVVPVVLDGKVIASISLDMITKKRIFYPDEIELCKKLANQVAVAIGKARYMKELSVLNKISHFISYAAPLDLNVRKILEEVRKHAGELLDVTNFYVALYNEENDNYSFIYHEDEKDDIDAIPKEKRRKGMTDYVRRNKQAIRADFHTLTEFAKKGKIDLIGYLPTVWLGAPLIARNRVLGVMAVQNYENKDAYDEHDLEVLETIASQTAIAIDNFNLFRDHRRQLTEIETLYEISQETAAESMNIKIVFDKILEKAINLSNADSAQIIFRDETKNRLKVAFTHGLDVLKGLPLKLGEGIASKVFESGDSTYTNDYHNHPDRIKLFDEQEYKDLFNSIVIVPLKWKGEVLGVIALSSTSYKFTENDIRLLERFSGTAAIAIAIAREISFRQTLLNNSPDAIVATDKEGTIKEFNKAAEQIFGYTAGTWDQVLGNSVIHLWGGMNEAKRIKKMMRESKNGTVRRIETYVTTKEGERIPVLFSGSILYAEGYGEEKEEIGSIGHIEDQRIISLKGRTRKLFQVIEEINRHEELSGILNTVLRSSIDLLEVDSGYILLKKDDYFEIAERYNFHQEQAEEINIKIDGKVIGPIIEERIPITYTLSSLFKLDIPKTKGGNSALIIPLSIEGSIIGVIYLESHKDAHFRKENELLQILSAEAAVAINRAQLKEEREKTREALFTTAQSVAAGQIATGFVHEVKNTLNTIALTVGNISEKIQKDSGIKSKQEYIDKIDTIETEIWRSYQLSKRLQKFGQRLTPQKTDIYLNDVVLNTIELLDSTIKKQKIKLETKLDQALDNDESTKDKKLKGNPVHIDKGQIEQVIINLILNAIEASNPKSRILIETKLNETDAEIRVTDSGKGIDTKVFPDIFKPFFTTKPDGVGLGLYISQLIIEESHQGKISANTKPDKGTTFSIHLPIKSKK